MTIKILLSCLPFLLAVFVSADAGELHNLKTNSEQFQVYLRAQSSVVADDSAHKTHGGINLWFNDKEETDPVPDLYARIYSVTFNPNDKTLYVNTVDACMSAKGWSKNSIDIDH